MEKNERLVLAIISIAVLLTVGTVAFQHLEQWTLVDSFYFSVSTLTTVGYGDLVPTNQASRLFTSAYMLVGVAIALYALSVIARQYIETREERIVLAVEGRLKRLHPSERISGILKKRI